MGFTIDLDGVSVMIGIPVYGNIPPRTSMSLARTMHAAGVSGIDIDAVMEVRGIVEVARDAVLHSFLKSDKQKLFWIDSDMVWEPDDFFRLLALSTQRDVVCAAYLAKKEGETDFQLSGPVAPQEPDELGLIQIWATGLGFSIVDRSVCEQIAAKAPTYFDSVSRREMAKVFRVDIWNGHLRGEDVNYFSDIRELGHTVWLDPSISLGHIGTKIWKASPADTLKRKDQ